MLKKELELNVEDAEPVLSRLLTQPTPPDIASCIPQFDPYHCEYVRTIPLHYVHHRQDEDGSIVYEWKTHYFDLILN